MNSRVLVAVDGFDEGQKQRISEAILGWALCEYVAQNAPEQTIRQLLPHTDIAIGWLSPNHLLDASVKFLQLPSVGYEAYCGKGLGRKKNFLLCNAKGVMGVPVAEHCIAMMLGLTRRIPAHVLDRQAKRWRRQATYEELAGSTACIVGLGEIGTEIARRCVALSVKLCGVRQHKARIHEVVSEVYSPEQLSMAVSKADHVIAAVPGEGLTVPLFNADVFDSFKTGANFYNVSRGRVVDELELIQRLRSGKIRYAGLDVFAEEPLPLTSPLWELENVLVTPHAAGRSVREMDRLCDLFVTNLEHYHAGRALQNVVSLD